MKPSSTLAPPPYGPRSATLYALGLLFSLLFLFPSAAAAERWTPLGPPGGDVLSLLGDPLTPGRVYAGTLGGGVFVSRDGGETWRQAADGLLVSQVNALAKGATPNAPLYAGTDRGVFRLDEGSVTWRPASVGLPDDEIVGRLAVDPGQPSTLYATVSQGRISGSFQLYKTTDGGSQWNLVSGVSYLENTLAVSATSPVTLYTSGILGVYRSTDRGASWEVSEVGLPLTGFLMDIAAVPGSPETLLVSVLDTAPGRPAVFRSVDGGRSFTPWSQGLPQIPLPVAATPLVVDPADPRVIYLGGRLGVFRSTDGGTSWTAANEAPANRAIRALAVASSGGTVFAGGSRYHLGGDAGVLRSGDRGESWQPQSAGLLASSVTSLSPDPLQSGRILIATETQGLFRSDDGGGHWIPAMTGIHEQNVGKPVRDPFAPSTLYVLAGASRFSLTQLYRTTDSGSTWAPVGADLGCCLQALTADPQAPGTLYLAREQNLLKSTNGGATWQTVNAGLTCAFQALAVHPTNPALLLGGCTVDSGLPVSPPIVLSQIHRSADGGATWARVFEGDGQSVGALLTLVFDPRNASRVFAGEVGFAGGGLYRSQDAGATWSKLESLGDEQVESVAVDPARDGHLLVGTGRHGVRRSLDGGATWQSVNDGLTSARVAALAFDPANPAKVWAGTGGGVHAIELTSPVPCTASPTELCLQSGRFRLRVDWEDFSGNNGTGKAVPLTDATGAFWFFGPENLELAVKVLDGRPVNGHFWVFFGGLSTVPYTLYITDTLTGVEERYENPSGVLASFGSTSAFPAASPAPDAASAADAAGSSPLPPTADEPTRFTLHEGRFAVEVRWRIDATSSGAGTGVPLRRDTAAFWFFGPENLELFVKILDGRPVNGHYWIFFGALSNVGFEITVIDTQTGSRRVYDNPPGNFGSRSDTELF